MTEEERMNEYALGAYRAAMLARGRVPESWGKLGSRRRRSWRAAARTVLAMHTRECLGQPLLAPLGLVEDRTVAQRIEDDDYRDPISGAPLPRVFVKLDDCTCVSAPGALCPTCHAGYGR